MKTSKLYLDTLRARISSYLEENKMTIKALERKAGLKYGALNNIVYGLTTRTNIFLYAKLAKVMGCTVDELMGKRISAPPSDPLRSGAKNSPSVPDGKMLLAHLDYILLACEERKVSLSPTQVCSILEQSYLFSVKEGQKQPDHTFVRWLLERSKTYGDV